MGPELLDRQLGELAGGGLTGLAAGIASGRIRRVTDADTLNPTLTVPAFGANADIALAVEVGVAERLTAGLGHQHRVAARDDAATHAVGDRRDAGGLDGDASESRAQTARQRRQHPADAECAG